MGFPKKGKSERPRVNQTGNSNNYPKRANFAFVGTCFNCQKTGHKAADCRSEKQRPQQRAPSNAHPRPNHARNNNERGNGRNTPQQFNGNCNACGVAGHRAVDCRKKCDHCNRTGHKSEKCFSKSKNSNNREKCTFCNKLGHNESVCFGKLKSNRSESVNSKVSAASAKQKTCYNCNGTGHIAKDCKNPKSLKQQQLPWPQNKRLPNNITALPRDSIKDWQSAELSHVKEFVRLAELYIDTRILIARLSIQVEDASKATAAKHSHWNRVTNIRSDLKVAADTHKEIILRAQLAEFCKELELCEDAAHVMQNRILKTAIDFASSRAQYFIHRQDNEPDVVKTFLNAAKERSTQHDNVTPRLNVLLLWLNNCYAATKELAEKGVKNVIEQDIQRKANRDARTRQKQTDDAFISQDHGADTDATTDAERQLKRDRDAAEQLDRYNAQILGFGTANAVHPTA